jgi:hypothetical protein
LSFNSSIFCDWWKMYNRKLNNLKVGKFFFFLYFEKYQRYWKKRKEEMVLILL